jgi:hypothetical protein
LSLRSKWRSAIAAPTALAIGAGLVLAASASAASIPTGQPTDTGNTSLYGLLNQTNTGLIQAQNLIVLDNAILTGNSQPPVDANFTTAFTSASQLTTANVAEIGTDIAASANTASLEFATCVSAYLTSQSLPPTSANISAGASYCNTHSDALSAAATQFTGTIQPGVAKAAASWASLTSLVSVVTLDPTDFPGGLYTVDGDVSVSSTATVTGIGQPVAYSATFGVSGAAAKGFVIPAGFSLTFPANFSINAGLVADEIQSSQLTNPPSSDAIGTASVTSPEIAALVPGSKGVDSSAQVFVVATQSLTQPEFEIYLGQGDYILGTITGVTFPLTVTFGLPVFNGQPTPLPFSSVTLNFPASTSPLKATSCTDAGTLTGTMTDSLTTLAATFGDTTDSGPQTMTATPTVVTNNCVNNMATGRFGGLTTGRPTLTAHVSTTNSFKTLKFGLPGGLRFMKSKGLRHEVSGAGIKSVRIAGGKLLITLKASVKSETIHTKKGLISESNGLINKIKKHKIKKLPLTVIAGAVTLRIKVGV